MSSTTADKASMPSLSRFTRRTVIAAADVLQDLGHARFDHLMLELDLQNTPAGKGSTLQAKATSLARFALDHPERRTEDGVILADELVYRAVAIVASKIGGYMDGADEAFLRALERDGFALTDEGELRRTVPQELSLPEADDEVHALLDQHALVTPRGHLRQALDAHARGNWAGANAQLRTFLEALLDEIANRLAPEEAASIPRHEHQRRRQLLANLPAPFLHRDLGEWADNGTGFINGLIKRLNSGGPHPGLSDEEDCTFRLHIVLLVARLLLRRFAARQAQP